MFAQETTGGVVGMVYDNEGEVVAYATVVITDNSTNETYSTYTQENGSYKFYNLTPSSYIIEVSYIGYQTVLTPPMAVKLGQEASNDITLIPESHALQEIKITGSRVVKDGSGYVVGDALLDDVPVI